VLNMSAHWVSQNLSAHDQCQWVASFQELLSSYTSDEELFCRRLVTGTVWIYHWDHYINYNSCSGRMWIVPHLHKSVTHTSHTHTHLTALCPGLPE